MKLGCVLFLALGLAACGVANQPLSSCNNGPACTAGSTCTAQGCRMLCATNAECANTGGTCEMGLCTQALTSTATGATNKVGQETILLVNNFSNYTALGNNLGNYSGDNNSMIFSSASTGELIAESANPNSYWFTLLAPQNACLDGSVYTHVRVGLEVPAGGDLTFEVQYNTDDCTARAGTQSQPFSKYVPINNGTPVIIDMPLSDFFPANSVVQAEVKKLRAFSVVNLLAPGTPNSAPMTITLTLIALVNKP